MFILIYYVITILRFKIESIQPKTPFAKEITTAYISNSSSAPTALFYTLKHED